MLNADVDSLLDVPVADSLVDYDAHCGFGDIVDDAGFAVVNFVRHAFLNGSVGFDINDVPDFILSQIS